MNFRLLPYSVVLATACFFQAACQNSPSSSSSSSTLPPLPVAGGYAPVEYTAGVKEAAEFAVGAQSKKENKKVRLAAIVQAEVQVVAGRNYRLALKVTQGKILRTANAVVYQKLDSTMELTSWQWATP